MKLMKRTNTYKTNNVTFNLDTKDAFSYSWWRFVAIVEGKLIFNNYRYSPTTGNHQHKVRRLLNELGITIDINLSIPEGIKEGQTLSDLFEIAENELCNQFLKEEEKKIRASERAKQKRLENKVSPLEKAMN